MLTAPSKDPLRTLGLPHPSCKVPFSEESSLDARVLGDDLQLDELRCPVEYLRHRLVHRLQAGLTSFILLPDASLLLALERNDHVDRAGVLLVAHRRRSHQPGARLLNRIRRTLDQWPG